MQTRQLTYLSRADIEAVALPMRTIVDAVEAALAEKGHGRTEMPAKTAIHPGEKGADNFIHAMPALIERLGAAGMKWVSGFPKNPQRGLPYISGLLILNDPATGIPIAVMDATWITAMRTGAATAVAVKHLGRPDAQSLAILGCGVQGRTNLEAVALVAPRLREVLAYDLDPERARAFVDEMRPRFPALELRVVANARAAVEAGDLVVTAGPIRSRPEPSIEASWLREGALAVPLDYDSYFTAEALARADRFYTDDTPQLLYTRAGGVYFQQIPEVYADLGEVIRGSKGARQSEQERLVCMNLGIAVEDMAIAPLILARARERTIGIDLPL